MNGVLPLGAEWLEADGAGGFASGTVAGYRTRRYHALLLTARRPPTYRVVLVNGFEAWVELRSGRFPLSTQHYLPDVLHPRGLDHLASFAHEPWPRWTYRAADGVSIVHECIVDRLDGSVVLAWRLADGGADAARLSVRLLLSGRDYHALMRENTAFGFDASVANRSVTWRPYSALPAVVALTNGSYKHEPTWYRNFFYREEAARGLDHVEDLASPGTFSFDLARGEAVVVLRAGEGEGVEAEKLAARTRAREAMRREPLTPLDRAAEAYVVRRGSGHTIIAGYPWFTDWGRDTFIAMRGLVLGRGRYDIAESILLTWTETISQGMLPNRFPDDGGAPEFNAVDASLWYVIAVHEFLAAARPETRARERLVSAAASILDGYAAGTRYGIRMDADGLIACGVAGTQLTWMDAKVGDRAVTPRIGKPVEVQALWINALRSACGRYQTIAERAQAAFRERFWNTSAGCLYDVVDADHQRDRVDPSIRPNQILAVGGLPFAIIDGDHARMIVATVERELLTPVGLRSLSRGDPEYRGHYQGDAAERDSAYHQGTVWPWFIGPFVDAWLNVNGDDEAPCAEARRRFLVPLLAQLQTVGLGHVFEIADGDDPHATRGCPFQAWSLGELIRAMTRTAPPVA